MNKDSYQKMISLENEHWWFVSRRKIIKKVVKCFFNKEDEASVLEIGCGSGGNLKMLSRFGTVQAIELNEDAIEIAQDRNLCKVSKGCLPNISTEKKYDLVCLFDVLEHIEEELETLQVLKRIMQDDGTLVLTVPAFEFLWSQHDDANLHKRRYTKKNLERLLEKQGYKVKFSSYFNFFLFPIISLIRLLSKSKNVKTNDVEEHSKPINTVLKAIFGFEKRLLPNIKFPFGVSILVVAQKITYQQ